MEQVTIFDTTLRDGEQSPGAAMTPHEKLRMAHALDELGVDVIEAGFPISSPDDFLGVKKVARELQRPRVAGLARAMRGDIERAAKALEKASRPRIHVFIATSPVHLEHKLRISEEECVARAVAAVELARSYVDDVEFSAEDATRTPLPFLIRVVEAAVRAGAGTINLPDTVGYALPAEIRQMIRTVRERVPDIEGKTLSVHCHNDLGLAVANTLAAVEEGARQVECTVNGIGERAGNAALEEVVMALHVRSRNTGVRTGIRTDRIYPTSRLLSHITGIHPQPNKAIVGKNAFAHEAGIHQDGMLKERATYEIMEPRTVGVPRSTLVLGKHSGRHALQVRLRDLGYDPGTEDLDRAYRLFKLLAAQKREILDEDLLAILHHGTLDSSDPWYRLDRVEVTCGGRWSVATVALQEGDAPPREATAREPGPIAAAFTALCELVEERVVFEDLTIRANTPGDDAVAEIAVRLTVGGRTFSARGASTDVVHGTVRALVNGLNKAWQARELEAQALAAAGDMWGV